MEGTSGDDQGIIARAASPRPDRRTIISNMHNGPGPDCLSAMPNPDAEPRRRTAVLPSPRALLLVVLAVALGAGAFALVWFNERDDYDFYRSSEGAPPTASPTSQQPLPAPSAGRRDGGLALPDVPGIAPVDATAGAEAEDAEAIAEVVAPPPPPPPAASGESRPPRPIAGQTPSPAYPAAELRRGRGGTVVLRVDVSADGRPTSVSVASSSRSRALDRAAMAAVRNWRFEPALVDGQPAAGVVRVPVEFTPQR